MRRHTRHLNWILGFGLAAVLAAPALAGGLPSASGAGQYRYDDGTLRNFAFTAHIDRHGNVKGQAQLNNRAQDLKLHVDIDCLVFNNATTATMSGTIISTSDTDQAPQNWISTFRVQDRGEGKNAPPDRISGMTFTPPDSPADCENPPFLSGPVNITGGNVQVDPDL